jgi:hypothetical protein
MLSYRHTDRYRGWKETKQRIILNDPRSLCRNWYPTWGRIINKLLCGMIRLMPIDTITPLQWSILSDYLSKNKVTSNGEWRMESGKLSINNKVQGQHLLINQTLHQSMRICSFGYRKTTLSLSRVRRPRVPSTSNIISCGCTPCDVQPCSSTIHRCSGRPASTK